MIEKRITPQLLDAGELTLTPRERASLTLPEHSTTIEIELDGETFNAQWSGRSRQLSGDLLTERLQDYGQVGGLLRLRAVDGAYRLTLLPPGTPMQFAQPLLPPISRTNITPGRKAARRRATVDRQFHSDDKYDWGQGATRTIGFLTEARELFGEQLKAAGWDPLELVELRLQGEELATLDDFEELLAVDVANVDRMPHQEAVARHALSRLRGRAVLADEVGLGKTIEAGLAMKELTLRGLARRILVLCPAPLRDQWREEMNTKFDLQFDVAYRGLDIGKQDKLIVSLALGARHVENLAKQPWDIVVVDEAHRVAGAGARKRRELVSALTTACRYAFFLTATPVQNDLLELYRLIELLRPGTFTSVGAFRRQYMTGNDPRQPSDPAALRRLISSAMIRTTRAQAGVDRVVRRPIDVPIDLGGPERELYALSIDLLRNVMRGADDAMRRRSLALRLTASPFSMGTTALRMAQRHPDERVRTVLNEIGHRAMDITTSARENAALGLTQQWLSEHGRVLIFTQHTDTVTGLLRRMAAEGLSARAFHGSMSAGERAATIAAFKSGDAPIMISTDAGAEGQNLQFCNCVLNYDLPWNPMRIEQRIGRVDRLTQPRDEVFVANLYARATVDENVYRLLAEKLRMFELLFGQVTTILGELDESKSATFESRVLEALFAENDAKMQSLLAQLGTELADARDRASTLIAADSGLSSWMASAFEHRKELTKAGSGELAPEVSERARMRQRRVQTWVRQVLKALHAKILHDTGEGEGAFITAQFDEEFADELGGRTLVHLAFDRRGLEHHPDAELCAVGSPVFDELLALLRVRGDLHATVPVIPDDIGPSPLQHSATTRLIHRRLVPAGTWSGHATFRAAVGEAETTEHVITAEVNGDNEIRLPRRPLKEGESLPDAFDDASKVIAAFERAAAKQLESLRSKRARQVEAEQARELDRIRTGYRAQIAEASDDDKSRLRRALDSEERRLSRRPDIRARAKLLALTLDEDDWIVEEIWGGKGDAEASLTYEWGLPEPPEVESDASQEPIRVLAVCSGAHIVDESEINVCESCDFDLCAACGDDAVFADCPVCGVSSCGLCRAGSGGLCRRCASPERAPELDTRFAVAWRLNRGATLLVGARSAELRRPGQAESSVVVPDEELHDHHRIRLRSYAMQHGLPADSGLVLRDLSNRPSSVDFNRLRLRTAATVDIEISVEDTSTSIIDPQAVSDLPVSGAPAVGSERQTNLKSLLEKLRQDCPPATPPAVVVTHRARFADTYLEAERLVQQLSMVADDGTLAVLEERSAPLQWRPQSPHYATLAEAELEGMRVALSRRNDAVLISARTDGEPVAQWIALPGGTTVAEQLAWFDYLQSLGTPGGRVGRLAREVQAIAGQFPSPTECQLVDRTSRPVAELARIDADVDLVPADSASLAALGGPRSPVPTQLPNLLPAGLNEDVLARAQRSFTSAVRNGFEIHEIWRGHGTATHRYRTFDGEPIPPVLDDLDGPAANFGVCRDGHFYEAGTSALCASCNTWSCRACDDIDHQASIACPSCAASVCRRCLTLEHTVADAECVICGDRECAECGRDPGVRACSICDRSMCAGCRSDELCSACGQLSAASQEHLRDLPPQLALTGAAVFTGSDQDATTLLINRGDAVEHAVVRGGSIERWVAFGKSAIDDAYRLRLTASRLLETQVVPVIEQLGPEVCLEVPHVVVQSGRVFYAAWSVNELGISGRSATPLVNTDSVLARVVAREFPAATQLPHPFDGTPSQVQRVVASMPQPHTVTLEMRWHRMGRDVAVSDVGLIARTLNGTAVDESVTAWDGADITPAWVAEAWEPVPTLRAHAATNSVEAVIVEIASLLALGIRVDDQSEWYAISISQQAPAATALARWMRVSDADDVSVFTDPAKIIRSSISNATDVSVRVHPLGSVKPTSGQPHPRTTSDALAAWLPNARVVTPNLGELPQKIRILLEQRFKTSATRTTLLIGARVAEVVTVEDGQVWHYATNLMPGQTDARRSDSITRVLRDEGVIDREGHFGPDGSKCPYCEGRICPICTDDMASCDCCSQPICRRCIHEPQPDLWLCPACATIRPPTRNEARQHGRIVSTRHMLIGIDAQHVVAVEHAKHRWHRRGADGEKHAIASPSVSKFLSERLP